MKLFQIDFQRLILLILPPCLRFPRIYALLLAMTFGIEELYRSFSRQREANLTRLRRQPTRRMADDLRRECQLPAID